MKKILAVLLLAFLASCSPYQKALKSEDMGVKYDQAAKLYDKGKYAKAIRLFEQMAPSYRGKPQAEKMYYMFAQSYYKTRQYYLAGYQFESFAAGYPKSEKLEEASYLGAKCFALLFPALRPRPERHAESHRQAAGVHRPLSRIGLHRRGQRHPERPAREDREEGIRETPKATIRSSITRARWLPWTISCLTIPGRLTARTRSITSWIRPTTLPSTVCRLKWRSA